MIFRFSFIVTVEELKKLQKNKNKDIYAVLHFAVQ